MDIQWDGTASLMRVTRFATADDAEALVARGSLRDLVGAVLAMAPAEQAGLMIRVAGPGWSEEHDLDAIRELAARPAYTGTDASDPGRRDADDRAGATDATD